MTREVEAVTGELKALSDLLDVYGADQSRWTAAARARFRPLIEREAQARRLLAEAAALDQILDAVPAAPPRQVGAVKERIFAQLSAEAARKPERVGAGNVVALQRAGRLPVAMGARRPMWREAAVLAASLLLGVVAGTAGVIEAAGISLPGLTSTSDEREVDVTEAVLGPDDSGGAGEESL